MNRTYRNLFHQRPQLTSFGNVKFPKGIKISLDGILAFAICLIPAAFISPVLHWILGLNRILATLVLAGFCAWLTTHVDLMGKPFPVFVLNLAAYFFRSHHSNGWKSIRRTSRTEASMTVDVSWSRTLNHNTVAVGTLPVCVEAKKVEDIEVENTVPVDIKRLDSRHWLIKRSTTTREKQSKRDTVGLQPGRLVLSKTGQVTWQRVSDAPVFGMGEGKKSQAQILL